MFVLVTAALSFHGAAVGKSSIKMMAKAASKSSDYSDALGVIEPTGFFDPLGLSSGIDQEVSERARARAHTFRLARGCSLWTRAPRPARTSCSHAPLAARSQTFDQYRTAELKHGRVAQLAVLGYIVPEIYRFPGEIAPGITFASIPNGVAAIDAIPALGWAQMIFLIGAVDYYGFLGDFDAGKPDLDPEELEKRQLNELQHGRLAMLAILELLRHDSQNLVKPAFDGLDHLITGLPFLYK
jgi:hypothetical protein